MRKQRSMPQTKQQENTPENMLNEMEASSLPETEFKMMVIKMHNELRRKINEHSENLNREIVSLKIRHRNNKKEPDRNEGHIN